MDKKIGAPALEPASRPQPPAFQSRVERHVAERVAELKRRVQSGRYRLDEADIAEAFIRRMHDAAEDEPGDHDLAE